LLQLPTTGVNMGITEAVKVMTKKVKGRTYYLITIPVSIARALELQGGELLVVKLKEIEVDGSKKLAIVMYRP